MGTRRDLGYVFVRACLTAALSVVASVAAADPPPPAKLRVGDITFIYDPQSWRMVASGDGAIATCLQLDCRDVVFHIRQNESDGLCSKDFVRETAERLFPMADRHAVNTFPAGRFGLTLSESRFGPDFDAPTYVFGCLDWQGRHYSFTSRPETVAGKSWAGGALHYLVSRASAPPARVETLTIGSMVLDVPTDVWRIAVSDKDRQAWLTCRPPACRDGGAFVVVSAQPADAPDPPSFDPGVDAGMHDIVTTVVHGYGPNALAFEVTTIHLGCRNYVPPTIIAIARHGGTTYKIAAPGGPGCRSSWAVPDAALMRLIRSARIEPGTP